ncbi:hypothetical protein Patl1_26897 [Pistacia atlantica]|uniref:Uncharacterized protein n=1 Tax=Pistacia atlantica TaxID=434234 RepID=A0ACC1B156_9ROSI|nr:hypothetical protein Patl1_26897 [Pistacia atlantica]
MNEEKMVTREEIELCIKEVMERERSKDFRRNSEKWKELAKEAVDEGHINPILQFSKRLASKGLKVTLVSSSSSTVSSKFIQTQATSINIEIISDDEPDEGQSRTANLDFFEAYKICVSQSLSEFIKKQLSSEYPPKFIIYDSIIPWILDIARGFGMDGAPFFTQPWAVNSIYYDFLQGQFKIPLEEPIVSLPSMPPLKLNDLPSFFDATDAYPTSLNMLVNQFSNVEKLNWLFCNTFDELEDETVKWMASKYPVKNIGPSIPSTYIDKSLCIIWELSAIEKEQLEEVAWGLKMSNCYFLWAVRESESGKLPRNFSEETSEKGLVVSWCPQLEVLAHKSVGCFVTHCGWNSTLEALSLGVAMVAMPQWTDQSTNAKFAEDVWRVGVRVRVNEKGIVTREEIEVCMREVMEGERGKEISRNSEKWKELAKEAVDEGGCSDKNIEEFVAKLLCS